MDAPKITLYVDINSATFAKCEVTYVPILLGGLMRACNNTPPINVKNKDKWINAERIRWARYFSVPIANSTPEGFPVRTLSVQRALGAISQMAPEKLPSAIEALYRSFWVDRNSKIGEPEGFTPVLETVLGKQGTQDVLSATSQPEIKGLLTANTDRAFRSGAFGLPWLECTDANGKTEGFWGVDHLGQVADFLSQDRSRDLGFKAVL
ncbi:thioredoxin-like protein [Penicillium hispanicum]|uniref:thioredoxin-like protein n=1 Tax=Penicillium hispanicum TaxID=1080232 RepID=UPI00253F6667|nr:thioredoxin-like protein [Penicillium hispanicum]KAJ5579922.1 thioredoxin-like protein [Penicillium hispanicum]